MRHRRGRSASNAPAFLCLRVGIFIEAAARDIVGRVVGEFPFLFGGAFIEATDLKLLSSPYSSISLPFWKGFH